MHHDDPQSPAVYIIPLLLVGLAVLRNARLRVLRIERLWITPAIVLTAAALALSQQGWPSDRMLVAYVAAAAIGAVLGWWRGRFTTISVDPQSHALTSRTSPVGMLFLLAVFAVRFGLRGFMGENASYLQVSATAITDVGLLLAVGLVCAQRLEIALRASRLLTEARASRAPDLPA